MDRLDVLGDAPRRALFPAPLLAPELDGALQALVEAAATEIQAPIALVTLILERIQFFRAHYGLPPELAAARATDRDVSFCQLVVRDNDLLEVRDAASDPRVPQTLVQSHSIRAYLGAPVRLGDAVLGSLCVIDTEPRSFSDAARARLVQLAEDVSARLAQLIHEARRDQSVLRIRASRSAFAELRNLFVGLGGNLEEARYEQTQLAPLLRIASAQGVAFLRSPGLAYEELDSRLQEAEEIAARIQNLVLSLEELLVGREAAPSLREAIQQAALLSRHFTQVLSGVRWPDPLPDARLAVDPGTVTAILSSLLSAVAWESFQRASPPDMLDASISLETPGLAEVRLHTPHLPPDILQRAVQEIVDLTTHLMGVTVVVHPEDVCLRLLVR